MNVAQLAFDLPLVVNLEDGDQLLQIDRASRIVLVADDEHISGKQGQIRLHESTLIALPPLVLREKMGNTPAPQLAGDHLFGARTHVIYAPTPIFTECAFRLEEIRRPGTRLLFENRHSTIHRGRRDLVRIGRGRLGAQTR